MENSQHVLKQKARDIQLKPNISLIQIAHSPNLQHSSYPWNAYKSKTGRFRRTIHSSSACLGTWWSATLISSKSAVITGSYVIITAQIFAVSLTAVEIADFVLQIKVAMFEAGEAPSCCWSSKEGDPFPWFLCIVEKHRCQWKIRVWNSGWSTGKLNK